MRLRYLAKPVARQLRADLLRRSVGHDELQWEAPERPVVAVPHDRLVGAVLLEMVSWRLIFLLTGPALTVIGRENDHRATSGIGVLLFVWFGVLILHAVWRRLSTLWDFTITESPDGLRVRHGLPSTSRQTIPPGRVQAVVVHQPLAWRRFGWAQVRMNVAGYAGNANTKSTMLLPVADLEYATALVGWLLGGIDLPAIPLERPPRRAAWRAPLWWRFQLLGSDDHLRRPSRAPLPDHGRRTPRAHPEPPVDGRPAPARPRAGLDPPGLDPRPVKTRAANRDGHAARALLDLQVERARQARLSPWQPAAGGALHRTGASTPGAALGR